MTGLLRCMDREEVRDPDVVDAIMAALSPREWRWCETPGCECDARARSLVSRAEWTAWFLRRWNKACSTCPSAVWVTNSAGRPELSCEYCPVAWS